MCIEMIPLLVGVSYVKLEKECNDSTWRFYNPYHEG